MICPKPFCRDVEKAAKAIMACLADISAVSRARGRSLAGISESIANVARRIKDMNSPPPVPRFTSFMAWTFFSSVPWAITPSPKSARPSM
ncbi:Uncharacterised protein [uncultured archaeon]|nr:Uncharacterised protein [uncultured archaeon]